MNTEVNLMNSWLVILLILGMSCSQSPDQTTSQKSIDTDPDYLGSYTRLPDNEAGRIVKRAIEAAGSWEEWTRQRSLSYTKIITFYDSLGNEIREVSQLHQYNLLPSYKAKIT